MCNTRDRPSTGQICPIKISKENSREASRSVVTKPEPMKLAKTSASPAISRVAASYDPAF